MALDKAEVAATLDNNVDVIRPYLEDDDLVAPCRCTVLQMDTLSRHD